MAVLVGSARSSYGNTAAGDQHNGQEVSTQNWYLHGKGWRTFICVLPGAGELIAEAMRKACSNDYIGYSQGSRNTLYNDVKDKGFDPSKTSRKVNTDCSALVRVCIRYAFHKLGISCNIPDFITSSEANVLLKSGYFKELKGDKYNKKADYLPAGAIQVTKTKGHTIVVITSGSKVEDDICPTPIYHLGDRILKNGMTGDDVKELQSMLIELGLELGSWGADGDFGDMTEMAVRDFQKRACIEVDGEVGPDTLDNIRDRLEVAEYLEADAYSFANLRVRIINGNCYVRKEPNTDCDKLAVACKNDIFECVGRSENGWNQIKFKEVTGWVSGKYSVVEPC